MLVESNGIKMRQALFLKHAELVEQSATYEEIEVALANIIEPVDEELGQLYNLPTTNPLDGFTSIIVSHALGKISDLELYDELNKRQKMYDELTINTKLALQYPNYGGVIGYIPTKLEGEKELGYPTLRQKYNLPLDGDIATMDTCIEVELKPL